MPDARNGLDYTIARQAEEQARNSEQLVASGYRLNLIVAIFLPLTALGSAFGMNLNSGLEAIRTPLLFWGVLVFGLVLGFRGESGGLLAGIQAKAGASEAFLTTTVSRAAPRRSSGQTRHAEWRVSPPCRFAFPGCTGSGRLRTRPEMIIRPPSFNCSTSGVGIFSGEQVTITASKGAASGHPLNPSPARVWTLVNPSRVSTSAACFASGSTISIV